MTVYKVIGRSEPNILCATDYLIGDMSDINYEFLLLNKPIILLSNEWLDENFPCLGMRISDASQIADALNTVENNDAFAESRKYFLRKAFAVTDASNADVALHTILSEAKVENPILALHHKNNIIFKSNLMPLRRSAEEIGVKVVQNQRLRSPNVINVAAHFNCLLDPIIAKNFCVHLDHGLKGEGTANVNISANDYIKNEFFPSVDLHLTAGEMGQTRTEMLLGPLKSRAKIGGYPKATSIIEDARDDKRRTILKFYGLNPSLPVVTYAPAGEESFEKPGGSLSKNVIRELKHLSKNAKCNVVVKLKYPFYFQRRFLSNMKKNLQRNIFQ